MNIENPPNQSALYAFAQERQRNIDALASAYSFRKLSFEWLRASLPYRYSYNFTALGLAIVQYPQDMVAVQEIIWEVRPDIIVETGVAHGGSLIHSASTLALLDYCDAVNAGMDSVPTQSARRVIGVDIEIRPHNRRSIENHPLGHKIELVTGSSISPDVVAQVNRSIHRDARVLVLLDSNHTRSHVHAELHAYAPLVTRGSYCVVFDTVIEHLPLDQFPNRPWAPGNSPLTAVADFLATLANQPVLARDGERLQFEVDQRIDSKLMISVAQQGYLRRL